MTFGNHSRNGRLRRVFSRPPGVPPSAPQMVLKLHLCHEDSEYVLSFEIGQREGGFYRTRTDTPSTVLVYIWLVHICEWLSEQSWHNPIFYIVVLLLSWILHNMCIEIFFLHVPMYFSTNNYPHFYPNSNILGHTSIIGDNGTKL